MNKKNIVSFIGITTLVFFLVVYIGQGTGYYENENAKKSVLTKEAIKRYEKDIKENKTIKEGIYLQKEKNYKNLYNRLGISISNIIEKIFNKGMKKFVKEIEKISK